MYIYVYSYKTHLYGFVPHGDNELFLCTNIQSHDEFWNVSSGCSILSKFM